MTYINPIYNVNYAKMPVFCVRTPEESKLATNPIAEQSINFKGAEALAAYNYNLINKSRDFDIPTIALIDTSENLDNIDGEPVYNSKNELTSVIKIIGNEKYIYNNNDSNSIEVYDINTNKKIKEQYSYINIDGDKMISVVELGEGKDHCQSHYKEDDGKISLISKCKVKYYPDGTRKEFCHHIEENEYEIIERSEKEPWYKTIWYDENKNIKEVWENSEYNSSRKDFKYHNNVLYKIEETSEKNIPNTLIENFDFLNNPNLVPHERFDFHPNAKNIEGEKTYYSNGAIESNTFAQDGKKYKYIYLTNGDLINVEYDNVVLENFGKDGYTIHEKLENGEEKETSYNPNSNSVYVFCSKDNKEESVEYRNGMRLSYCKNDGNKHFYAEFNPDGSLIDCKEYYMD